MRSPTVRRGVVVLAVAYRRLVPQPSVTDVIARMTAILSPLASTDGVACFSRLYRAVTEGVQERLTGVTFSDASFLARLDARFANLFFTAVESDRQDPAAVPRAWAPLFDARSRKGIAPLQFALAGMNAHINHDLPVALVTTHQDAGIDLARNSPQHADYLRVDNLLAVVEARVKQQYVGGWLRRIDNLLHRFNRIDDIVAMWDIARARDAAWTNAEALWAIRDDHDLYRDYLATLDRSVGFAGRGLLIPSDTLLARIGRALGGT